MNLHITGGARAWLGALAFSGAVGGHTLAYLLVEPGAHERAELLRVTGHHMWSVVVGLALAGLVGGLAGCLQEGAARLRGAASHGSSLYASTAVRLVGLQVSCFLLLETAERTMMQGHLHLLTGEPAVLVGIVVQAVTALLGAALLVLFARVVERLRLPDIIAADRSRPLLPIVALRPFRHRLGAGEARPRGPPFVCSL